MKKLVTLSCVLTFAILSGCSGGGDDGNGGNPSDAGQPPDADPAPDGSTVGPVAMTGAIQKGPFIIGSNVVVAMLDPATGNPTGANFPTTTRNDFGEFDLMLPGTGAAEIQTTGFYFNEILNTASGASITMRALAFFPFSGPREVHVNALTHLGHLRAKKLVGDGVDFEAAIAQAESELRAALPLARNLAVNAGTDLDILGGDSDANAYLFALSCVLAQTALNEAAGSVDAALQEQMSVIALDLEDDGALTPALVDTLTRGARFMDADLCTNNMEAFVAGKGSSATIPDIRRALDFDGDGTGDRADTDADGDGRQADDDAIVQVTGGSFGRGGMARDEGGTVWTWSFGGPGSNGAGCDVFSSCPPLPVTALSAIGPARDMVITGEPMGEFAVLLTDGRVGWWGTSVGPTPVLVPGLDDVTWIGSPTRGGFGGAIYAIRSDDTVWKIEQAMATEVTEIPEAQVVAASNNGTFAIWVLRDGTVEGHDREFTETYAVAGLTGAVDLVASEDGNYALAVDGDGDLWRWPVFEAVVDGSTTATRVSLSGPVSSVSRDGRYVVLADGSAWRLGEEAPVMVTGIPAVAYMSSGVALLRDGTVVAPNLYGGSEASPEPLYIPR